MEKLRTMAQYQLAVHPLGVPGDAAQEIVNTFLANTRRRKTARRRFMSSVPLLDRDMKMVVVPYEGSYPGDGRIIKKNKLDKAEFKKYAD